MRCVSKKPPSLYSESLGNLFSNSSWLLLISIGLIKCISKIGTFPLLHFFTTLFHFVMFQFVLIDKHLINTLLLFSTCVFDVFLKSKQAGAIASPLKIKHYFNCFTRIEDLLCFTWIIPHFYFKNWYFKFHFSPLIEFKVSPAFCSDPLVGGGTIYSNGFFVQSILADRYIHRREMWVVASKSSSSVEIEIKIFFFNFVFFQGVTEV